jgi:hypothetical protein
MKIEQQEDKQYFAATEINFSELKTIRDGLKLYAKNGSTLAGKLSQEIETTIENMQV